MTEVNIIIHFAIWISLVYSSFQFNPINHMIIVFGNMTQWLECTYVVFCARWCGFETLSYRSLLMFQCLRTSNHISNLNIIMLQNDLVIELCHWAYTIIICLWFKFPLIYIYNFFCIINVQNSIENK